MSNRPLQAHWKEQVGKKRDCVTADSEKFYINFNFELLDDTYVMPRRVVKISSLSTGTILNGKNLPLAMF